MSYHCEKCNKKREMGCFARGCPGLPLQDGDWQLPELPPPDRTMWQYGQQIDHYTADQMRDYARQAKQKWRGLTEAHYTELLERTHPENRYTLLECCERLLKERNTCT